MHGILIQLQVHTHGRSALTLIMLAWLVAGMQVPSLVEDYMRLILAHTADALVQVGAATHMERILHARVPILK